VLVGRHQLPRGPVQRLEDRILVPLPHGHYTAVDPVDEWVLDHRWYRVPSGHAVTSTKPPKLMHKMIGELMGIAWSVDIDHANMDPLDNRRVNLRPGGKRLNSANREKWAVGATSQYKGVGLHKASGLWRARIKVHGREQMLGYFRDEADAARAYNAAAAEVFGPYARLNKVA
jgi:hypothetical protein